VDTGLRLMIYDRTCTGPWGRPGLSHSWWLGAHFYRVTTRFDATCGVANWSEALDWLARFRPEHSISEIQFWGHGKWGQANVCGEILGIEALDPKHPLHEKMRALRPRLSEHSLWWFRTCETFGANAGRSFAQAWTQWWRCRAAGHTYIIGPIQSGLHGLSPGERPLWPADEGLLEGTAASPTKARHSSFRAPHTITCLHSRVPRDY